MRQGSRLCARHSFNLSGQFGIKDFTCSGVYGMVQICFSIPDVCYVEIPATCQIRFSASVEVPSLMVDLHSGSS